jgi:hypothetical protein
LLPDLLQGPPVPPHEVGGVTGQPKAKLMARLRASRQREGWVRLELWVPASLVKQVRDYVKRVTADSGSVQRSKK